MTIKDEFMTMKWYAIKRGAASDLSGSKRKQNALRKMVEGFKKTSDVDFQIGIITEEKHDSEMDAYELMKYSVDNMDVY